MKLDEIINGKDKFKVVYLGGSITEGAGASSVDTCYASLTSKWLEERYPNVKIESVNAGIGGTPSSFGMCRCKRDVLTHNPDMVFVEFAVNDSGITRPDLSGLYMESIVRQLLSFNKDIKIVFLFTIHLPMIKDYNNGKIPVSIISHTKVARYYNIPIINVGGYLRESFLGSSEEVTDYLGDTCHPCDAGYEIYTRHIKNTLPYLDFNIENKAEPLFEKEYTKPQMINAAESFKGDFKISTEGRLNRFDSFIYSDIPGDKITYEFDGSYIGLYISHESDGGTLEYSIDGGEKIKINCRDHREWGDRVDATTLCAELKDGHHVLEAEIIAEKDEKPGRYCIRIGAFLTA